MRKSLEVAIAGAGPAGLAAALYLKRFGHRVTIFERFDKPAPVGSGLILQPTGLSVLSDLGLFAEISALGARIDRLYGADAKSGRTVLDVSYNVAAGNRFGIAVHRAALFGVLHKAVQRQNIAIHTGADVESVVAGGEKHTLTGANGSVLGRFDLVIDASGSRSKLRQMASRPREARPLKYGALWASLAWRGEGFDEHALLQRYDRASVMIGVLPIGRAEPDGGKMAAFFWSIESADVARVREKGLAAWKEQVAALWPDCQPYLDQIHDFGQLTHAHYAHHTLLPPVGRGFAIIGDAAHSTSPQLGQGANMALLDAAALAYAIERSDDVPSALEAYARARRLHVRVFQALSMCFTPFYQSNSVLLPLVRDRLVPILARIPPAPKLLAAMVSGTVVDPFGPIGISESIWAQKDACHDISISA
ncbi:FAD-dependent monooxygenase [Mesorhizobium sp. CGMCC 1.15528]|uniref:FAD-dependent monooxygenase n=1 Tax=Mesorhizobium zhangyense TaxID=1776730 RepID=A0A7C9V521_9HYPH|nr:NAD(P)/FAD-dependent oxidoreductase [Mesorhizobium zhangyense]NGN40905.1 FAD-dependent monooxygenase [Mesorhizobium zhangyense]